MKRYLYIIIILFVILIIIKIIYLHGQKARFYNENDKN